jgi:hypothetical protein
MVMMKEVDERKIKLRRKYLYYAVGGDVHDCCLSEALP